MAFNLVELATDPDQHGPAPCAWGNIVKGHACYCHNEATPCRKCPIWRQYGASDPSRWNKAECAWFEPSTEKGAGDGEA